MYLHVQNNLITARNKKVFRQQYTGYRLEYITMDLPNEKIHFVAGFSFLTINSKNKKPKENQIIQSMYTVNLIVGLCLDL